MTPNNLFRSEAFNPNSYLSLNGSGGMFLKKSVQSGIGIMSNQHGGMPMNKRSFESKTINVENIILCKDKRTTVMLRNIPLKYTISNLVDELNLQFIGKFDFVNMPTNNEVSLLQKN